MSERLTVKQRLTVEDEGIGYEGRCHACGSVYRSALFLDRAVCVALAVACPCGQQVEMGRIGVVRHKSSLPVFEGMK